MYVAHDALAQPFRCSWEEDNPNLAQCKDSHTGTAAYESALAR